MLPARAGHRARPGARRSQSAWGALNLCRLQRGRAIVQDRVMRGSTRGIFPGQSLMRRGGVRLGVTLCQWVELEDRVCGTSGSLGECRCTLGILGWCIDHGGQTRYGAGPALELDVALPDHHWATVWNPRFVARGDHRTTSRSSRHGFAGKEQGGHTLGALASKGCLQWEQRVG